MLDALELAVELDGPFSSFIPEELAVLLAAEDAGFELLDGLDAAGWELLASAELAAVLDEDTVLLEELLPELAGSSGPSGIPAQEVRIIADITAAAAALHTTRKIGFFNFISMHFLLHNIPW